MSKQSRLIIQGLPTDRGRCYHFDIPFPNGHIDVRPGGGSWRWLDPRPELQMVPGRIKHIVEEVVRLTTKSSQTVRPLVGSLGVRGYHLRIALASHIPPAHLAEALALLDKTVIDALGADLLPDGEDGHRWYNDSGPEVSVVRRKELWSSNLHDPDGQRRHSLPEGLTWPLLGTHRHVKSWEHISFFDALRLPRHVLLLMSRTCSIEGLVNFRIDTGELIQEKGLAWQWPSVKEGPLLELLRDLRTGTEAERAALR